MVLDPRPPPASLVVMALLTESASVSAPGPKVLVESRLVRSAAKELSLIVGNSGMVPHMNPGNLGSLSSVNLAIGLFGVS